MCTGAETALAAGGAISATGSLIGGLTGSSSAESTGKSMANYYTMSGVVNNLLRQNSVSQLKDYYGDASNALNDNYNTAMGYYSQVPQVYQNYNDQVNSLYSPYYQAGTQDLASYQNLLNDPSSVVNDPGYTWQLGQGLSAIDKSSAASGKLNSGSHTNSADSYAQGQASTEYNNALSRYYTGASLGTTAASAMSSAGYNTAQGLASNYNNQASTTSNYGGALASLYSNEGNAIANTINGGSSTISSLASQYGSSAQTASNNSTSAINSAISGVGNSANNYATNSLISALASTTSSGSTSASTGGISWSDMANQMGSGWTTSYNE